MRLRVLTLNVWALPWPVARDVAPRVRAIGAALGRLAPDVAAFQEVWTEASVRTLVAAGREHGLAHAWHHPEGSSTSGLLVLSRHPFARARFEMFALRGRPERVWHGDYQGRKGFAELAVETREGPLVVFATHLHAQYADDAHDDYHATRVGQVPRR